MAHGSGTRLKPIPSSNTALQLEAAHLGLLKPNPKLNTGRKQLLSHIYTSSKIGRSTKQGSILLVGSSGVGKSSTINHLFNFNKQGVNFAKTSDKQSETHVTTEYIVQSSSEQFEASALQIGVVDSPGFNDTGGSKQDACNFYSIKKFYEQHDVLRGCYPNLIFLLINSTDKRLIGPNSNLSKSLKCLSKLDLVDKEHPNVIGIMTHADQLGRTKDKWEKNLAEKKKIFNDAIFDYLQVPAKLVAIENDLDDLDLKDDWTLLVDGTKQPLNLFNACSDLFEENGDKFGKLLFNACFEKCTAPTMGFSIEAKDAANEVLSVSENEFHDFLVKTIQGGLEYPLVREANQFIQDQGLGDEDSETIQSLASGIMRLGITDKHDLTQTNVDGLSFLVGRVDDRAIAKNFLLSLGVKDSPPIDMDTTVRVIGLGYNLLNEKTAPSEIFKYEKKNTHCGLLVPTSAGFTRVNETCHFMDFFDDEQEMMSAKMQSLNISLELDFKGFSTKAKSGYNASSSSKLSSSTHEYSFLIEQRLFELKLANFDELKFTDDFLSDIKNLPRHYALEDGVNRSSFRRFFDRWGHFFVTQAYGGGSVELKINKSVCASDKGDEQNLKAELMASLSVSGSVSGGISGSSSSHSKRALSQSSSYWKGGDTAFQTHETLSDKDAMAKWKVSLMQQPVMLQHDLSLLPISDIVDKADSQKSLACRKALEGLVGGKFKLQKSIEAEREKKGQEEQRNKEKYEADARDAKNRAEAAANNQPSLPECFPSSSLVSVLRGGFEEDVLMKDLKVGQVVMSESNGINVPSKVIAFLHADPEEKATFLRISCDDGSCITLSENHLLMVGSSDAKKSKMAGDVAVGDNDIILRGGAQATVVKIERVDDVGVFCPLTENGMIFVNGTLASCYASTHNYNIGHYQFSGHQIAHFGVTPLRWWRQIRPIKDSSNAPIMEPYIAWLQKLPLPWSCS